MFAGSLVALITPFKGESVDEKGFEKFVAWQIKEGTDGLVPCGTTGESPTISTEEKKRLIDICIQTAKGSGVPVIAGTGSNSTADSIALTRYAKAAGAASAMGFMAQGGDGCISVTANIAPRLCADMHDAWKARDLDKVFEIQDRLMPLHKALFVETSPAPVKYGAELIGQASAQIRLPLVECTDATKKVVRDAMVQAGLLN